MVNNKKRLFEVMGRLDKTFKPKLNEGFEEIEATGTEEVPAEMGAEVGIEVPAEEPAEEQSPEEKLAELTAKVDEIYALVHGEGDGEGDAIDAEPEGISIETGEIEPENLQEWNFDKKKGEKEESKEKEEKSEEKGEKEESEESEEKVPVEAVAKVGK